MQNFTSRTVSVVNKTIALIPARGNSKSVPRKNLKPFGGKPLMIYTINAAYDSKCFDVAVISSEDDEILSVAAGYGALGLKRPIELSRDDVQTDAVAYHSILQLLERGFEIDTVCLLQATSPFRTGKDIRGAINLYETIMGDVKGTVIAAYKDTEYHWHREFGEAKFDPLYHNPEKRLGRQWEVDSQIWSESGAIYVFDAKRFLRERDYRIPPYYIYEMSRIHNLDINEPLDFEYGEWLLEKGLA